MLAWYLHLGKVGLISSSDNMYYKYAYGFVMMTSSSGNMFRVTGTLCGEFTGHRWIPLTKASDAELWCFLWSAPEKWLGKQSRRMWFETLPRPLWRHCNDSTTKHARKRQPCLYILHLPDINDAAWVCLDNGRSGWDTSMSYGSDRRYVMVCAISDVGRWRCH